MHKLIAWEQTPEGADFSNKFAYKTIRNSWLFVAHLIQRSEIWLKSKQDMACINIYSTNIWVYNSY